MRNKKAFRIPIALHIYSPMIFVILLTVLFVYVSNSVIISNYIRIDCNKRINNAVISCQNFASAFRTSIDTLEYDNKKEIREYLLSSIASATELSNDSSIILFSADNKETNIIWPNQSNASSSEQSSLNFLIHLSQNNGLEINNQTQSTLFEDNIYYYRILKVEYSPSRFDSPDDYETFYMLVYLNSAPYYSFENAMTLGLLKSIMISIVASAFICIIVSFPLFYSSQKLARFANRISRSDFTPVSGHIVSRELSDLADTMNVMASKLQETDIEQKTFFQNASHELRTPLMSIQGYAEGLKYNVFSEDKKEEAIDIIIDETTRLTNLVENLLSISKMDMSRSGKYEIKKQKIDVREIVELIIGKVRGGFLLQDKELFNNININEVFIYANENDIIRMFENILSNCLHYASKAVTLTVKASDKDVVFTIEDDGPGISSDVMNNLFERFAKGTEGKHGIGLSLAKAIAEEHNGKIDVSNKAEGGAKFVITLPVVKTINQLTSINNSRE